ncbi:MAG: TolC family protein, partial [Pseudomonadota bacterium]
MNQIRHFRLKAASATSALILSGCVTVPEVPARPEISKVEASFDSAESLIFDGGEVNSSWWQNFDDPLMTSLVESALAHNKDIAVAEANIAIAQAFLNRQGLTQTPSTRSLGGANLGRQARDGADIEITADVQIGASWEYDAFRRIASIIDSAELDLLSAQELRRDVAVIIASETALAYTDLRGNQVLLAVAQTNADLQGESLDLLRALFDNGRATRLDLERAEAQFRATLASLPVFEADIRTAAARLVSLTGQTSLSETLMVETALGTAEQTPVPPLMFAVASPEALIRRRPDIRVAEADIASLLALGQAERARLFPTLTFDANLFSLFSEGNDLGDSFGFGIGPSIVWDG